LPIADLGRICRERQVLFLADTSQSLGGMSLSSDILHNVDILVGVAYKWLLGPYGSAYGCFSKEAMSSLPRTHASWLVSPIAKDTENLLNYTTATLPGARKFDRGQSASFLITAALAGALEIISEVGLREIEQHNAGLVAHFLEHLPKGNTVAGPQDFRSNIVCVRPATKDAKALKALLAQNSIDVSVREGLVRFSFHFFNTREHVEKTLPLLTTT
ncbi:MAG: aminotransferase class V-fold PLP-dependent enzyme, partial [Bdellovibrionales bacterium]